MILVTVGDDHAADLVAVLLDIGVVGDDHIHAEHIAVGERHTAVEDDHIALALEHRHVLADLVQTAEEGDADRRLRRGFFLCRSFCGSFLRICRYCRLINCFGGSFRRLARCFLSGSLYLRLFCFFTQIEYLLFDC